MTSRQGMYRFAFPREYRYSRDRLGQGDCGRPIEDYPNEFNLDPWYGLGPRVSNIDGEIGIPFRRDSRTYGMPIGTYGSHRPVAPYHYSSPAARMMTTPRTSHPIGKAMKNLHKQISKAEECYGNFLREYESDVHAIKKYAEARVLKTLWEAKVNGKKRTSEGDDEEDRVNGHERKFQEQQGHLLKALDAAISSTLKEVGTSQYGEAQLERQDRADRLISKVSLAFGQIRSLLNTVSDREQSCKDLLTELRILKALVDPEAEMNRDLYRGTAAVEAGEDEHEEESKSHQDWE